MSQGTIYLYFENKTALPTAAFLDTKSAIHAALMDAAEPHVEAGRYRDAIEAQWIAIFDFATEWPDAFTFAEQISAARLVDENAQSELDRMAGELAAIIEQAVDNGTLREAPVSAIIPVLTVSILQLAKHSVQRQSTVPRNELQLSFDMVWRGIANDDY